MKGSCARFTGEDCTPKEHAIWPMIRKGEILRQKKHLFLNTAYPCMNEKQLLLAKQPFTEGRAINEKDFFYRGAEKLLCRDVKAR
jgi:hypothetical protein